jgi:hypothetical protein
LRRLAQDGSQARPQEIKIHSLRYFYSMWRTPVHSPRITLPVLLVVHGHCRTLYTSVCSLHLRPCRFGLGQPQRHRHRLVHRHSGRESSARLIPLAGCGVHRAQPAMAVRLEGAHAQLLGQGEGLVIGGFGLLDIRGVGVAMNNAKLVQRKSLIPAFLELTGLIERLARMLPGLSAATCQTTDLTELRVGITLRRARVDTFADRLLQERVPLREASLQRIGRAQACRDRSQNGPVARGATEGQALVAYPDGVHQIPLGEVQEAKAAVGNERCRPSTCQRGEAEGLFPVAQPSAKVPSALKVRASHAWERIRQSELGVPEPLSASSTFRFSNSAAWPKSPMA